MTGKECCAPDIELRIRAHPEFLSVVRCAIRQTAKLSGLNDADVDAVSLAMDEALTNVIRHGYGGPCSQQIIIQMGRRQMENQPVLEFVVQDFGKQVDPATIRSRDLEDVRPGGLGVHIIRSVMDVVEYSQGEGQGMRLRMVKRITAGANSSCGCDKAHNKVKERQN